MPSSVLYTKLPQMLRVERKASVFTSSAEMSSKGCAGCLTHWSSTPGWKQNICPWRLLADAGESVCCIQRWVLLPCPMQWLACQLHFLSWWNWYLTLSSLLWECLKQFPLDLAVMILQNSEPPGRLCLCHSFLLCTRHGGCLSSNSKTSPCWGAAHWHAANSILDITLMLMWVEPFGPVFFKKKKKSIQINVWF